MCAFRNLGIHTHSHKQSTSSFSPQTRCSIKTHVIYRPTNSTLIFNRKFNNEGRTDMNGTLRWRGKKQQKIKHIQGMLGMGIIISRRSGGGGGGGEEKRCVIKERCHKGFLTPGARRPLLLLLLLPYAFYHRRPASLMNGQLGPVPCAKSAGSL